MTKTDELTKSVDVLLKRSKCIELWFDAFCPDVETCSECENYTTEEEREFANAYVKELAMKYGIENPNNRG